MPSQYKLLISVLAVVIGVIVFVVDTRAGGGIERWVALVLGPMAVVAIWLFPEPKSKEIRKEAAERR